MTAPPTTTSSAALSGQPPLVRTAATARSRSVRLVPILAYVTAFSILAFSLVRGWSYYNTPLILRARHVDYWSLKPGGDLGRLFGIVGAAMMTLLLLYSVRKRVKILRKLGLLSRWLDVHIFFGTVGPLFIVLHTSFKVSGIVALSFWSMIAVAVSGIFGRYLYRQIPKNRAGNQLTLNDLAGLDEQLTERLCRQFRIDEQALERLRKVAEPRGPERPSLAGALASAAAGDLTMRWRLRAAVRSVGSVPRPMLGEFKAMVRQKALLQRRIVLWSRMQELFFYWHVLHKPFAIVMYVFMFAHILVAVFTGYGFGGGF